MSIHSALDVLAGCPWNPGFRSDDFDEVRRYFGDIDGSTARVAHSPRPMGLVAHGFSGGVAKFGRTASRVGQTARWVVDSPVFQLAVPVGSVYRTGRQVSKPTSSSSVVMLPAAWEWTRSSPPGVIVAVQVETAALQEELKALSPDSGGALPREVVLHDIDETARDRVLSSVASAALAMQPGASARQLNLSEARLLTQLVQLMPHPVRRQRAADLSAARVRDLEDWIDANLGEPITLGALCRVAGVGARCLQRTFEHRRGMSPMRFVAERRLAATHHALLSAGPEASVTQIALASGFDHVGRFAQLYRDLIGELPSRTLAGSHQR